MDSIKDFFKSSTVKNIIIVFLTVAILIETIAFAIVSVSDKKENSSDTAPQINLNVNIDGISAELKTSLSDAMDSFTSSGITPEGIAGMVRTVVYSDMIVNTIMSLAYPLLFEVLTHLEMMEFATNIDLYPTGPLFADKLTGKAYTCCDKDGTRKPLSDVLKNVGDDWSYMDTSVTWYDTDGTQKTTSLWNSIKWNITDKDTFYAAMADMSEGLRGVLEICIQGKSRVVNINVVDFLLNTDAIPINLDAATIYNSSEKSGYEICLISLFNTLGLVESEYPAAADVCAYTNLGDIWRAILEPVLYAVEKAAADPVQNLTNMLINFAYVIENGILCNNMRSLRMDATFHELASAVMGFENGELYNLGNSLIEIIGEMGLDISGTFNNLLDGLLKMISKSESADMPEMDMATLFSYATATTLSNGTTYYIASPQLTIDFLIDYIINEKIIESIINLTELKGTPEATTIITSISQSRDNLSSIVKTLFNYLLKKISVTTN